MQGKSEGRAAEWGAGTGHPSLQKGTATEARSLKEGGQGGEWLQCPVHFAGMAGLCAHHLK